VQRGSGEAAVAVVAGDEAWPVRTGHAVRFVAGGCRAIGSHGCPPSSPGHPGEAPDACDAE